MQHVNNDWSVNGRKLVRLIIVASWVSLLVWNVLMDDECDSSSSISSSSMDGRNGMTRGVMVMSFPFQVSRRNTRINPPRFGWNRRTSSSSSSCVMRISKQALGSFDPLVRTCHNNSTSRSSSSDKEVLPVVKLFDLSMTPQSYQEIWELQKELHDEQLQHIPLCTAGPSSSSTVSRDAMVLVQHDPVYTLGTGSDPSFVLNHHPNVEVVRIERGGEVTCHAPGQLVAYPILDLRHYKQDIHWYIRALEEVIILALTNLGIPNAKREEGVTGVWVDGKKVAAIGVKARRWVTMHGIAINVEPSCLKYFNGIVPCGLVGREVACCHDFLPNITTQHLVPHLLHAFQQIFQIQFQPYYTTNNNNNNNSSSNNTSTKIISTTTTNHL
jgi:lipoyl(octanoyl) transferase